MRLLTLSLLWLITLTSLAADAPEAPLTLYYSESPPYSFPEGSEAKGVLIDYVEELFIELGTNYEFRSMSWNAALNSAAKDPKGIFIAGIYSRDRQIYFKATNPIYAVTHQFYTKKDSGFMYDGTLKSLLGLRIGVIKGWTYDPLFQQADHLDKTGYDTTTMGLVALFTGEIDMLATDHLLSEYILTYQLPNIKYDIVSAGDLTKDWLRILVNRSIKDSEFSIEDFNSVLKDAEAEDRVSSYRDKYLKPR